MPDLTPIFCKGTVQATGERCDVVVCETDGKSFLIQGFELSLDPPRVKCSCGYVTRLRYNRAYDSTRATRSSRSSGAAR
jgi:hypothetical protein